MLKHFPFTLFAIIIVVQLGVLSIQIVGGSRSPEDSPAIRSLLCVSGVEAGCPDEGNGEKVPGRANSGADKGAYLLDAILDGDDSFLSSDNQFLVEQVTTSTASVSLDRASLQRDSWGVGGGGGFRIQPVPEPNSALTIGGGCVALALFARRRCVNS